MREWKLRVFKKRPIVHDKVERNAVIVISFLGGRLRP